MKPSEQQPVIVFLGPTLSVADAQQYLPSAYYLPPVRCGDVLRALRLNPSAIAIIDGVFETTASVWHKEILFALEQGIPVFGASSMGALRARECAAYGMQGEGSVVARYHDDLEADDAVAVLHRSAAFGFCQQNVARVTIDATLAAAREQGCLDEMNYTLFLKAAALLFYPHRTLAKVLKKAEVLGADPKALAAVEAFVAAHGWCDVKREDALHLLKHLATLRADDGLMKAALSAKVQPMARSAFFRAHYKTVMCRPFGYFSPGLPIQEQVALMARYFGTTYRQLRRLAYLLAAAYALALHRGIVVHAQEAKTDVAPADAHDASAVEIEDFRRRSLVFTKLYQLTVKEAGADASHEPYLLALMRLSQTQEYTVYAKTGAVLPCFAKTDPARYRVFDEAARWWWVIDREAERRALVPGDEMLQKTSVQLRTMLGLYSHEALQQWLETQGLTPEAYALLVQRSAVLQYVVLQNNLDALGFIDQTEGVWWLREALWRTGLYRDAKRLLQDPEAVLALQRGLVNQYASLWQLAEDLDFSYDEVEAFCQVETV